MEKTVFLLVNSSPQLLPTGDFQSSVGKFAFISRHICKHKIYILRTISGSIDLFFKIKICFTVKVYGINPYTLKSTVSTEQKQDENSVC